MKTLWFPPLLLTLLLWGCSPDRTLETLVPRSALAVVLVDHPALAVAVLNPKDEAFPLSSLDADKPWALVVVPTNPPGFFLALALAKQPQAWAGVQSWAQRRGGLTAARVGTYGVLYSPGLTVPAVLEASQRFDLDRVRAGGDPLDIYVDVQNVLADSALTSGAGSAQPILSWAQKNLAGTRLGLAPRKGGLEAKLTFEWTAGSSVGHWLAGWPAPADLSGWTALLPQGDGIRGAASLPPELFAAAGSLIQDSALRQRWTALTPLLGPRVAIAASPRADGTWSWSAAVESKDPQGVRQALKTLVAGGDLQRSFARWAIDGDTPLIYQDRPDGFGGIRAQLSMGSTMVHLGYGPDKVSVAGGAGALEALRPWERDAATPAPWFQDIPPGSSVAAQGSISGLGALGSVRILTGGTLEATFWIDGPGLKSWEAQLPQWVPAWAGPTGWWPKAP